MKNEESRCAQNEESLLEAGLRHNSSFLILHSSLKRACAHINSYLSDKLNINIYLLNCRGYKTKRVRRNERMILTLYFGTPP